MPRRLAQPRWASTAEAAEYSGINIRTIRDWIHKGILPATRIGPRILQIDLNDVDDLRQSIRPTRPTGRRRTA